MNSVKIEKFDISKASDMSNKLDAIIDFNELTPHQRGDLKSLLKLIEKEGEFPKEFNTDDCEICVISEYVGIKNSYRKLLVERHNELIVYDMKDLENNASLPAGINLNGLGSNNQKIPNCALPNELLKMGKTNIPISKPFIEVLNKLQHEKVHITPELMKEIMDIPEIKMASKVAAAVPETVSTYSVEQLEERAKTSIEILKTNNGYATEESMLKDLGEKYDIRCNKKAYIVLGLPSSGKSSVITNRLLKENRAFLLDSDEGKQTLPEFNNGFGANAVHIESKFINGTLLDDIVKTGANVVIPKVGGKLEDIQSLVDDKLQGYEIEIHLVEVEDNTAMCRLLKRFIEQNRYLKPTLIQGYGNKPSEVFEQVKGAHYVKWSNEVEWYEKPILVEQSDGKY